MFLDSQPICLKFQSFSSVDVNEKIADFIFSVGIISKVATSLINVQKVAAFEGNVIFKMGNFTNIYITLIIPHSICSEADNTMFTARFPYIMVLIDDLAGPAVANNFAELLSDAICLGRSLLILRSFLIICLVEITWKNSGSKNWISN